MKLPASSFICSFPQADEKETGGEGRKLNVPNMIFPHLTLVSFFFIQERCCGTTEKTTVWDRYREGREAEETGALKGKTLKSRKERDGLGKQS